LYNKLDLITLTLLDFLIVSQSWWRLGFCIQDNIWPHRCKYWRHLHSIHQ